VVAFDAQALGSVLVGIMLTLFAWGLLHFNQRRVRRDRLRRAVLLEVAHIGDAVGELARDVETAGDIDQMDVNRTLVTISSDILESDLNRLTMLTTPEIDAVYAFYEDAQLVRQELERGRGEDSIDLDRLHRYAERTLDSRDRVQATVFRSRLSRLTEWSKAKDRSLRSR